MRKYVTMALGGVALAVASQGAFASCADLYIAYNNYVAAHHTDPFNDAVHAAGNGGYGLPMWVGGVDETGKVCFINNTAGSGKLIGNQSWLGSRIIAVQKADTANDYSLDGFAISTSNLYGLTLDGGSLFGLQHANPIDATMAYQGSPETYGTPHDFFINKRIGGLNVFGGGLAAYLGGHKVGAIGVSGDTSCTDHAVAWRIRALLGLDNVPAGFVKGYTPAPAFSVKGDEMIIKLPSATGATANNVNVQNTYKQVSCAHNAIANPTQGAATGVIIETTP